MKYETQKKDEFADMVNYFKGQYQRAKGKIKRFDDSPVNEPTTLGRMLLYS